MCLSPRNQSANHHPFALIACFPLFFLFEISPPSDFSLRKLPNVPFMKDSLTLLAQYLRCFLFGLFLVPHLVSGVAFAQTAESDLFHRLTARCDTDSIPTKTLYLNVDALAFFKDNEFDGNIAKGYTLPGVRLTPYLTYRPLLNLNLQMGLTALCYDGTNYYPNYAFHDIVTWKGNAY